MYRLFILLGAKRIQEVMEAKGYIVGSAQVIPPILFCTIPCMSAEHVINELNSVNGEQVFVTTQMHGIQFVDTGRLQAHSQRMLACVVASAAGIRQDKHGAQPVPQLNIRKHLCCLATYCPLLECCLGEDVSTHIDRMPGCLNAVVL